MLNFIVVDDAKEITTVMKNIINQVMLKSNLEYKIHLFNDYDEKFMELMKSDSSNKIYFLDIETKSASGIDIARKIRRFDNFENKVKNAVKKSIEIIKGKRVLKFAEYSTIFMIPIDDILYITRDSVDRKCVIKTLNSEYRTYKSLSELSEICGDALVQTHRACFVNEKHITEIDKKNKIITFDNGESINLISDNYKKELLK